MKKAGGDVWALLGLIALFGVMAFVIAGQSPQMAEVIPHRTTFSARPGGLKAAYLLLAGRGVRQQRIDSAPGSWPKSARVVITATPYLGAPEWSKQSAKAALAWVESGNTLVVASDAGGELTRALGLTLSSRGELNAALAPRQPLSLLGGVKAVKMTDATRWTQAPAKGVVVLAGKERTVKEESPSELPALVALPRGKGRVFALSSASVWENRTLDEADNARFLVQLVESQLASGDAVAWDEYHQGFEGGQSFWTVIGVPGQLAIYQLIAVSLLAVYAAGRRFGLPRPLQSASRVSSEYVASLADLYRRAHASDGALAGVYNAFRRDLCRTIGVATDVDDAIIARQAASLADPHVRPETEERLRRLLSDCALRTRDQSHLPRQEQTVLSEPEMLRLAQEMEAFRKDLGIGRTR